MVGYGNLIDLKYYSVAFEAKKYSTEFKSIEIGPCELRDFLSVVLRFYSTMHLFLAISSNHEFHETCNSVTFIVLVNSQQR